MYPFALVFLFLGFFCIFCISVFVLLLRSEPKHTAYKEPIATAKLQQIL